jgi:hypothetical protein
VIQSSDPRSLDVGRPPPVATPYVSEPSLIGQLEELCLAFETQSGRAPTRLAISAPALRAVYREARKLHLFMPGPGQLPIGPFTLLVQIEPAALVPYVS